MKSFLIIAGLVISSMVLAFGLMHEPEMSENEKVHNEVGKYVYDSLMGEMYVPITPLAYIHRDSLHVINPIDTMSYEDRLERELVYRFGAKKYCIYKHYEDSVRKVTIYNDSIADKRKYENFVKTMHKKDSVYAMYLKSKCEK